MTKITGELKFLIVENVVDSGDYLLQSKDYPLGNTRGKTVDEAMEKMCLQILVHLAGRRTGEHLYIGKGRFHE